jgi:hypothetical protein
MSSKEVEKYYFELFRKHYPLPAGEVEYCDRPDVIIHADTTTGVEITNFFLDDGSDSQSEQVQRNLRSKVVEAAQEIFEAGNPAKVSLCFGFDKSSPIREKENLAARLAKLATDVVARESGVIPKSDFQHIPELSFAYVRMGAGEGLPWQVMQLHQTQVTSMERLREIIRRKEIKSKAYKPCDEYWLLIVVDFMDRAQDQEFAREAMGEISSGVFDRILVYKTVFEQVVEINPSAS